MDPNTIQIVGGFGTAVLASLIVVSLLLLGHMARLCAEWCLTKCWVSLATARDHVLWQAANRPDRFYTVLFAVVLTVISVCMVVALP